MQFHGVQYLYNMKTQRKKTLDPLSRFDQKYAFDPLTTMRETHDDRLIIKAFTVILFQILVLPGYITILTNVLFSLSVNVVQHLSGSYTIL